MNQTQNDILSINQIQLLLAEKRTSLAVMRTGIAILVLPLSIFSVLIATSKLYEFHHVKLLFISVIGLNSFLIIFSLYLIIISFKRMLHYDLMIQKIKRQHYCLNHLI